MATGEPVEFRPPWWATKYNPLIDGAPSSLQLCMLLWILHYLGDRWAAKYNESQFRYRGVSGTMTQGPSPPPPSARALLPFCSRPPLPPCRSLRAGPSVPVELVGILLQRETAGGSVVTERGDRAL